MKLDRLLVKRQVEGRLRWYKTHSVWNFGGIPHTKDTRLKIPQAMKEYWRAQQFVRGDSTVLQPTHRDY